MPPVLVDADDDDDDVFEDAVPVPARAAAAGRQDEDASDTKANSFDKYLKHSNMLHNKGETPISWHMYNTLNKPRVVVVYQGLGQIVWPISEETARLHLLLHKPGLRSYGDLLLRLDGQRHACYVDAFRELLARPGVPPQGLVRAVRRAFDVFFFDDVLMPFVRPRHMLQDRIHRVPVVDGAAPDTPVDDAIGDEDGAGALFGGADDEDPDAFHVGWDDLRVQECQPGQAVVAEATRATYGRTVDELGTMLSQRVQDFYGQAAEFGLPRDPRTGGYVDPILSVDNEGQRVLLCAVLNHLLQLHRWLENPNRSDETRPKPLRGIVAGIAGTGKSFVVKIIVAACALFQQEPLSAALFAPTGAAAGSVGGSVPDRALQFARVKLNPKMAEKLNSRRTLAEKQATYQFTMALLLDEIGMWGQVLTGNTAQRSDEFFNMGKADGRDCERPSFGDLDIVLGLGDVKQLPPVLDTPNYVRGQANPTKVTAPVAALGERAYMSSLDKCFLLDQPVRQQGGPLLDALTELRNGQFSQAALDFWNSRHHKFLVGEDERWRSPLENPNLLIATCFNADRDNWNMEYVKKLHDVCVFKSVCEGQHVKSDGHAKLGMAKSIPPTSHLAVGMMCKLTVNTCPEMSLYNTARGIVRDVLYAAGPGYQPGVMPAVVLVDFPNYVGPPFVDGAGREKWVPIVPVTRRCDCGACQRTGIPLVVAKADSIHSLQGLTAGESHAIKQILAAWRVQGEQRWPGILYVVASRVETASGLALLDGMAASDLQLDRDASATWQAQNRELERQHQAARTERIRVQATTAPSDFVRLVRSFVEDVVLRREPAGRHTAQAARDSARTVRENARAAAVTATRNLQQNQDKHTPEYQQLVRAQAAANQAVKRAEDALTRAEQLLADAQAKPVSPHVQACAQQWLQSAVNWLNTHGHVD